MRSYRGASIGAIYAWHANNGSLNGLIKIIESTPTTPLVIKLDIMQMFEAHNIIVIMLVDQGEATSVTPGVSGSLSYASRLLSLCFDFDRITGDKYMYGLASLKTLIKQSNPTG